MLGIVTEQLADGHRTHGAVGEIDLDGLLELGLPLFELERLEGLGARVPHGGGFIESEHFRCLQDEGGERYAYHSLTTSTTLLTLASIEHRGSRNARPGIRCPR